MVAGSLQEKKGFFYIVLNLRDEHGKRKAKWISTGLPIKGNKRRAETMLDEERAKYTDTAIIPGSNILFIEHVQNWLQIAKHNIQITTYGGYQYTVERRIVPFFQKHPVRLDEFEPKHLQAYYQHLFNDLKVSANTVIHHHALIRKSFDYAMKMGLISSNPADRIERPKKDAYVASYYDDKKLAKLFECVRTDPIELMVLIAAYYGMRRSEVIGLKWDAVDFANKTLIIRHSVSNVSIDGKYITCAKDILKNKSSFRTLPLIPAIEEALLKTKATQEKNRELCLDSYNEKYLDYICVDSMGKLINPGWVTQHFAYVIKKEGLPKIRYHDLRHSCASLLLQNGVSLKEIQEWLGHSNFSTTANIYSHLEYTSKLASAETIQNVLGAV